MTCKEYGSKTYSDGVVIPSFVSYNGQTYKVTRIGDYAFYNCSWLTSVVIPEGVTSIGDYAFFWCESLRSINIPNSLTDIGIAAFGATRWYNYTCRKNEEGVISYIGKIAYAYEYMDDYDYLCQLYWNNELPPITLKIQDGTIGIACGAFMNRIDLTSIIIPNSVSNIGNKAFSNCFQLTTVFIPENVKTLADETFEYCHGLASVIVGANTPISISSKTFTNRTNATLYVPLGSKSAYSQANYWKEFNDIKEYTKEGNLYYELHENTYTNNTAEIIPSPCGEYSGNIVIPSSINVNGQTYSVTSIGEKAFSGCTGLTGITIPESITSIHHNAFEGCSSLVSVTFHCKKVGNGFARSESIKEVIFGNEVTEIGENAFLGCSGLTSVVIPNNVISIRNFAFKDCSGLTSVTIGNGVKSFSYNAFYGCSNIISLNLDYEKIMNDFPDSKKIETLKFGSHVETIGNTFSNCSYLTSVTIPNNVTLIGENAFSYCSSLTSVIIGNGVKGVSFGGYSAFAGCPNIISLTLNYEKILYNDFPDSKKIKTIEFGNNVKTVGMNAFSGCSSLTSVIVGNGVTSIGDNAFDGCYNAKYYANRGTDGLLSVWNYGVTPYENGSSTKLLPSSIGVTSKTQTTIKYYINNAYSEFEYDSNGESLGNNEFLIKGIRAGRAAMISLIIRSANNTYRTSTEITTNSVCPTLNYKKTTASSLSVEGICYIEEPADIISSVIKIDGVEINSNEGEIYGLDPNTTYNCIYNVRAKYNDGEICNYEGLTYLKTDALIFGSLEPKVISVGNVIVAAETNLDDDEANAGFEWRRMTAPEEMQSNSAKAPIFEGTMEGYIRNLYIGDYWKFRPYYESNAGNRYYGEWVIFDPTNTSYFEPTVHTYATINIQGNSAEVKGYFMRGTDQVLKQGFMYWINNTPSSLRKGANGVTIVPANAMVVEVPKNQQVMTATLPDLKPGTEYNVVAFVTTEEGDTYGELQTFKTAYLKGDVNGDWLLNSGDVMTIYSIMAGKSTLPQIAGDVNGDGLVNSGDVMTVYSIMAGKQ